MELARMRICYVLLSPTFGMHLYTADYANRMVQLGHEVHVVTTTGAPRTCYAADVTLHTCVDATNTGLSSEALKPRAVQQTARTLCNLDPDIAHFTGPHLWNAWLVPFLGVVGVPTIHTLHDLHPHVGAAGGRLLYLWNTWIRFTSKKLLVHGERYREKLLRQRVAPNRVTCTPLTHLFSAWERQAVHDRRVPSVSHEPWALFFGRLKAYKGLDVLVEAARRMSHASQQPRQVAIAGPGRLGRFVSGALPPNIKIRDYLIGDDEAERLFGRCGLVVLPYREATQSALVAAAYFFQKPVIVTAVGALPEYVENGVTGWVVPPNDPHALADVLQSALEDPARLMRMGRAGRKRYEHWRRVETAAIQATYADLAGDVAHDAEGRADAAWASEPEPLA
jgi:glycosyltransferase involved in cell wall biosynthesis